MTSLDKKTVSLVLGSGGARGLAHIGIIKRIEEHGYQIRAISGCSMGSLVGGIYAAGKLGEFEKWIRAITTFDILSLVDISFGKGGFVKGDKVINTLRKLVGERQIEDLPISFTAVAADIAREKEVWINQGSLFDAIRASISLPFFFTPFPYKGMRLIDGGVLNPVPIAPTFQDHTDFTIAVNLGGPPRATQHTTIKTRQPEPEQSLFEEKIAQFVDFLKDSVTSEENNDWDMFYIANQSFDAMQGTIARQKLAAYPPDVVIEISRNACGTLEFDRADEMIALGYEYAETCLKKLEEEHMSS